ncbi:ABC transporter ATP-binding protein [Candidatus Saccharibacteria bacterium]|nr:ABC transporter ATP-binding protein [Candidatus Saccharibacteria bacterium]
MAKREIGSRKEIIADNDIAIHVSNLSKSFKLPTERAFGLKQAIFNRIRGVKGFKKQSVLSDINLDIKKGEFIGIVGRNGSGKSTFLKTLAGIYYPEKGEIIINGSLIPFIELGVGFNPELTGRENVYLNGALLGFSRSEVDNMYDKIWKFAELEEFQDQKLKNYSSGMQVRLAFSIAIRAKGDILLLDEVLAVGDAAFQKKCEDYFRSLHGNQTVVLVTHSMENITKFCDRAILIEKGKIVLDDKPKIVAKAYKNLWS